MSSPTLAEIITVTSLADNVTVDGEITLREAIRAANTDASVDGSPAGSGTDDIVFAPSLFSGGSQTLTLNGTQLTPIGRVTITGPGADLLTLDANSNSRHFYVDRDNLNNKNSRVTVAGMTLTGGSANRGAVVYADDDERFEFQDCILTGNASVNEGAVGYTEQYGAVITRRCQMFGNSGSSVLTGGGTGAQIAIFSSSITGSTGNGIHMNNGAFATLTNSTISGSTSDGVNAPWSDVNVIGSTISGNGGDGIENFGENMVFRNSTIVNNSGWGVRSGGTGTDNREITMFNTIVAGNTAGEISGLPLGNRYGNNIFGNPAGAQNIANGTRNCIVGDGAGGVLNLSTIINPVLADNGGPTLTHALVHGSPAISGGDNTKVASQEVPDYQFDQRGEPFNRIMDGTIEIGSLEVNPLTYTVDTLAAGDNGNYTVGDLSLEEAVTLANGHVGNDIINFDPALSGTIPTSGRLEITETVVINGPGADVLILDGQNTHQLIKVTSTVTEQAQISGLTLRRGFGASGGAVLNSGRLHLAKCMILDSTSLSGGGGILSDDIASMTMVDCHLSGNTAEEGGGIATERSLTIINSSIVDCTSTQSGGGIYVFQGQKFELVNSTVSGNTATGGSGGGIFFEGPARLTNSTVTGNKSLDGGGIHGLSFSSPVITLNNSIVAGNFLDDGVTPDDITGQAIDAASAFNVIGDSGTAGGLTDGTKANVVGNAGSGTLAIGTVLETARTTLSNGTEAHALILGGPAHESGDNSLAVFASSDPITTDQSSSAPRLQDGNLDGTATVDRGAVERANSVDYGDAPDFVTGTGNATLLVEQGNDDFRISVMGTESEPDPTIRDESSATESEIAYNATDNEFLVVWHGDQIAGPLVNSENEVYARRIDGTTGATIGDQIRISTMGPDGTTSFIGYNASVAWNSSTNQYLVVWQGDDDTLPLVEGEQEVFGQIVSNVGTLVGGRFRISSMGPDGDTDYGVAHPEVAYNATENEFLVVWRGEDNTGPLVDDEHEIYAQRVSAAGALTGGRIRVSTMGNDAETDPAIRDNFFPNVPVVSWNSTDNQYLVAWYSDDDTPPLVDNESEIFGQLLDASGNLVGSRQRLSVMGDENETDPDIRDNHRAQSLAATYSPTVNEFLVVWHGYPGEGGLADGEWEVFGQRVNAQTGATSGNQFRISEVGGLGSTTFYAGPPKVSYSPATDAYLVVFRAEEDGDNDNEVFARRVSSSGALLDPDEVPLSAMGPNGSTVYNGFGPSAAYNPTDDLFLVTWKGDDDSPPLVDNENEIFGQLVTDEQFVDYASSFAEDGPIHRIIDGLRIGALIDAEPEALAGLNAMGDDTNGSDDEDGIIYGLGYEPGQPLELTVQVTNNTGSPATLYAWVDFNQDGMFDNVTERTSAAVATGTTDGQATLTLPAAPGDLAGTTVVRLRLSTDAAAANPTGLAANGEVEDHQLILRGQGAPEFTLNTTDGTVGGISSTVALTGTSNIHVTSIAWTNSLTGASGSGTPAASWTIPTVALGFGDNVIDVIGSNDLGEQIATQVTITRDLILDDNGATPVHYVSPSGSNTWPFDTEATAANTLQDAVDTAMTGDTVRVLPGIYAAGGRPAAGQNLANRVVIAKNITVVSTAGAATTTIQGAYGAGAGAPLGTDAIRGAYLTGGATLEGFTISNGATTDVFAAPLEDLWGGGVFMDGSVTLTDCIVDGGRAFWHGGGVYARNGATITGTTISNSIASVGFNGAGGGFYIESSTIENSTVAGNSHGNASTQGGGGYAGGTSTITGTTFENNTAREGGGLYVRHSGTPGISGSTFRGNTATTSSGGGLYLTSSISTTGTLSGCIFENNTSGGSGGGVQTFNVKATVTRCSFIGNDGGTGFGGGLSSGGDPAFVDNSLFSGNRAGTGAGAYIFFGTINNSTFSGNSASGNGGALATRSQVSFLEVTNSILYNNAAAGSTTSESATAFSIQNGFVSFQNSLVANSGAPGAWFSEPKLIDNGNNIDVDPLFVTALAPLTAPSTAGDFHLQSGSPAFDAGSLGFVLRPVDRDSEVRIQGGGVDLGAFEDSPSHTWNGTTTSWTTAANWLPASVPNPGASLVFPGTAPTFEVELGGKRATANLAFGGTTPYTIRTGELGLSNSIQVTGSSSHLVESPVVITSGVLVNTDAASKLSITGDLSGPHPITKIGDGELELAGSNSFGGGLEFNDGKLTLGSNTAAGSGTITVGLPSATVVSEDFTNGYFGNRIFNFSGLIDDSNGNIVFTGTGNNQRTFLSTFQRDFTQNSFVAEITVTNGANYAYFGVGRAVAFPPNYEPLLDPNLFMRVGPDTLNGGDGALGDGTNLINPSTSAESGTGTHRLQLSYDAKTQLATFAIQKNYAGGPFVPTTVFAPINASDNGFNDGNASLFFGGSNGATFDDFSVVFSAEPTRTICYKDGADLANPMILGRPQVGPGDEPPVFLEVDVPADDTGGHSGQISESGSIYTLRKTGDGTFSLGGFCNYSGGTEVQAGTLVVNGTSGTGGLAVSSGATVGGNGNIPGNLDVASGGIVSPGSGNTLTVDGPVKLNGTYSSKIDNSLAGNLVVIGDLDITNATLQVTEVDIPANQVQIIAQYNSLTGAAFASLDIPSAYTIDYNYQGLGRIALLRGLLLDDNGATPVHYVSPNGSNTWPYTTEATAANNIQDAVDTAATGDVVRTLAGTYNTGGQVAPGESLFNRVLVRRNISLVGVDGAASTIIEGAFSSTGGTPAGPDAIRCVYLSEGATIEGFTITGGSTSDVFVSPFDTSGGGVFIFNNGTVKNCIVDDNRSFFNGAGIYGIGQSIISGTTISNNIAGNNVFNFGSGGGFHLTDASMSDCTVTGNSLAATSTNGGGGYFTGANSSLDNTIFNSNSARQGGGVYLNSRIDLSGCRFLNNTAETGGGIYGNDQLGGSPSLPMSMGQCEFLGNSATNGNGGGFYMISMEPHINRCAFRNNSASGSGGGFYVPEEAYLNDSLVTGNFAGANAGGASIHFGGVANCTVSGNRAGNAGGAFQVTSIVSTLAFANSIIFNNEVQGSTTSESALGILSNSRSNVSFQNCIVQGSGGSGSWSLSSRFLDLGGNLDTDPLFVAGIPPSTAPTASGDFHLQASSPALDSGTNRLVVSPVDFDGEIRIRGAAVDLGAFEDSIASIWNGTTTSWSEATNWLEESVPAPGANLVFPDFAPNFNVALEQPRNARTIHFQGSNSYFLSGGPLTIGPVIGSSGSAHHSIGSGLNLTTPLLLETGAGTSLRLTGSIIDGGHSHGLTKRGAGSLSLGAGNTFGGDINHEEGLLEFAAQGAAGTGSINIDIESGGFIEDDFTGGVAGKNQFFINTFMVNDSANNLRFTGTRNNQRSYALSGKSDFASQSFIAEVTVTTGTSYGYFGMGAGDSLLPDYEPGTTPHAFLRFGPDGLNGGDVILSDDLTSIDPATSGEAGTGTHRLRMDYDALNQTVTFAIQKNYPGGTFAPTTVFPPIDTSNNAFTVFNGRIFFGGNREVIFDDFRVTFNNEGERRIAYRNDALIGRPINLTRTPPISGDIPEVALSIDVPSGQSGSQLGSIRETGGAFTLRKTGDGTLITGNTLNNYSGGTDVLEGTLLISGRSGTGPLTVAATATLTGSGTIAGPAAIQPGGNLAPGTSGSISNLNFESDLRIAGRYRCDLAGNFSDRISVTGQLDIRGAILDLSEVDLGATNRLYIIATYGSLEGTSFAAVENLPTGFQLDYSYSDSNGIHIALINQSRTSYEAWALGRGLPEPVAQRKMEDPNGDGLPNLVHFAFDTDPLRPGSGYEGKYRVAKSTIEDTDYLTLTLPVRKGATFAGSPQMSATADGVVYTILGNNDLATPFDLQIKELPSALSDGLPPLGDLDGDGTTDWEYRTFRLETSISSMSNGYICAGLSDAN